ncbi:MAG: serine hydrolase [Defluviitaleaceae bacterium]|nr:serine hydrolase [Defluviitaleaceae bacterium]
MTQQLRKKTSKTESLFLYKPLDAVLVNETGLYEGYFFIGGWFINEVTGIIEHGGDNPTWNAMIRMLPESNIAVVTLTNVRLWVTNFDEDLAAMTLEAAINNNFVGIGRDWNRLADIGFTVLCAAGVVYLVFLVRSIIKLRKRLQNGGVIKSDFSVVAIRKLITGSALTVAGLILYYIAPMLMGEIRADMVSIFVPSYRVAATAVWIMLIYEVFSWWSKYCVNPKQV